jgi:hypothetical protein
MNVAYIEKCQHEIQEQKKKFWYGILECLFFLGAETNIYELVLVV